MEKYKLKKLRLITKFGILELEKGFKTNKNYQSIDLSKKFWNTIFDVNFFQKFIDEKYIPSKKNKLNKKEIEDIKNECNFIGEKLDLVKDKMNFKDNTIAPGGNDIFFSYRLFSNILYYYNDYYSSEHIKISLRYGLVFLVENNNIDDFILNIDKLYDSDFFLYFIDSLFEHDYVLYKFEIFWPDELLLAGIISKILKSKNKNIKVAIDFSGGNEQFDFSQWIPFIKEKGDYFFKTFDNFIIRNDFGNGIRLLLDYFNGLIEKKSLKNIMYFDGKVFFNDIDDKNNNKEIFDEFLKSSFDKNKRPVILGKKAFYSRFLPYKCYWANCDFCAINSQNKFEYNNEYSYDFFIDKWVAFISEHNIFSINFKDEAIPPRVIIKFAQKIIEKGIKLNYQFRTRFEKLYTYSNCKILYNSGARFCGIGLESAVTRVNEQIGNKGNIGITIQDKIKIIHNFDKAGISLHNYSIMGFPGETEKESIITYDFLKNNIILSNFFTCTPNVFGLMRGTKIFKERKKMGIEIDENELNNPFSLNYNFRVNGKRRNLLLLDKLLRNLHFIQFLPWLSKDSNFVDSKSFWDYIDRSYIFYLTKRYNKSNPFYLYKNINNEVLKKNFKSILNEIFNLSDYIQLFEKVEYIYVYDWVMCREIKINLILKNILLRYNNKITLNDNFINNGIDNVGTFEEEIINLLKSNILLYDKK